MATVFISHASADTDVALRVERWLTDAGHTVLLDRSVESGIRLGEDWRLRIETWLREADAMVCLITKAYTGSPWCAYEVGAAKTQGCAVLPLVVEPNAARPLLADLHDIDLVDSDEAPEELLAALRRVDGSGGVGWPEGKSPFPGLTAFEPDRQRVFCGRAAEVGALAKILVTSSASLLPVIGPSGCGKSSLVRAGLVPRIAAEPDWLVLDPFTPRTDPEGELARALARVHPGGAPPRVAELRARLRRGDLDGIARELLDAAGPTKRRLLVVVDQLEELGPKSSSFLSVLQGARGSPVRVVAILRSADYDGLLAERGLDLADQPYAVRPLGPQALRLVIEEPATIAGLTVEPELVAAMVDDTCGGEALPLLAYTLAELARGVVRGGALSAARYAELGGVKGALVRQADAALADAQAAGCSERAVLDGLLQLVTVDLRRAPTRARVDLRSLSRDVAAALKLFVDRAC